MSWLTFATNASQFITGPFGISIFILMLGISGMRLAFEHRWHSVGYTIAGGVIAFSAAWAVQTFMV